MLSICYALLSSNFRSNLNPQHIKIINSHYEHVVMVSLFLTAEIKWFSLRKKEIDLHPGENCPGSDSMIKKTQRGASVPENPEVGGRAFVFVEIDCE